METADKTNKLEREINRYTDSKVTSKAFFSEQLSYFQK
jgi:hypothetical protein